MQKVYRQPSTIWTQQWRIRSVTSMIFTLMYTLKPRLLLIRIGCFLCRTFNFDNACYHTGPGRGNWSTNQKTLFWGNSLGHVCALCDLAFFGAHASLSIVAWSFCWFFFFQIYIWTLVIQLAQLWPSGFMDNHGIKGAICRSKERKRVLLNSRHQVWKSAFNAFIFCLFYMKQCRCRVCLLVPL